jgi:hypothetical protein
MTQEELEHAAQLYEKAAAESAPGRLARREGGVDRLSPEPGVVRR